MSKENFIWCFDSVVSRGNSAIFNFLLGEIDNYLMNLTLCVVIKSCDVHRYESLTLKMLQGHWEPCSLWWFLVELVKLVLWKYWDFLYESLCYTSTLEWVCVGCFLCGCLVSHARNESTLMCSASHTSPGLTRHEMLLKALRDRERDRDGETLQDKSSDCLSLCKIYLGSNI